MNRNGGEYRSEVYGLKTIAPDQVPALEYHEDGRRLSLITCVAGR